jgi:hypothetical protein
MSELGRLRRISLIAGTLLFLGTLVWMVYIILQSKLAENSTQALILLIISGTLIAIGRYRGTYEPQKRIESTRAMFYL